MLVERIPIFLYNERLISVLTKVRNAPGRLRLNSARDIRINENVPSTSHTSNVFHFKVCVTLCLEKENGIYTDQTFRGLPTHTSNHVAFFFFCPPASVY